MATYDTQFRRRCVDNLLHRHKSFRQEHILPVPCKSNAPVCNYTRSNVLCTEKIYQTVRFDFGVRKDPYGPLFQQYRVYLC